MAKGICSIDGCEKPAKCRGWCSAHYSRWQHHGDPLGGGPVRPLPSEDRFWVKVDKNGPIPEYAPHLGPCWLWIGTKRKQGRYGQFQPTYGRSLYAHRYAYELVRGPVPEHHDVDHLCRVRLCVNPNHLEAVPHRVNVQRGLLGDLRHVATRCQRGHEFTPENT